MLDQLRSAGQSEDRVLVSLIVCSPAGLQKELTGGREKSPWKEKKEFPPLPPLPLQTVVRICINLRTGEERKPGNKAAENWSSFASPQSHWERERTRKGTGERGTSGSAGV